MTHINKALVQTSRNIHSKYSELAKLFTASSFINDHQEYLQELASSIESLAERLETVDTSLTDYFIQRERVGLSQHKSNGLEGLEKEKQDLG